MLPDRVKSSSWLGPTRPTAFPLLFMSDPDRSPSIGLNCRLDNACTRRQPPADRHVIGYVFNRRRPVHPYYSFGFPLE